MQNSLSTESDLYFPEKKFILLLILIMEKQYLQIDPADNVLVALQNLEKGAEILHDGNIIHLEEEIPAKHKFAIHPFEPGDEVKMYGVLVGKVVKSIPKGGLLTTENIQHDASSLRIEALSISGMLQIFPNTTTGLLRDFTG